MLNHHTFSMSRLNRSHDWPVVEEKMGVLKVKYQLGTCLINPLMLGEFLCNLSSGSKIPLKVILGLIHTKY